MGQAVVDKVSGATVNANVTWSGGTKDFKGNPVAWKYQLFARLIRPSDSSTIASVTYPTASYLDLASSFSTMTPLGLKLPGSFEGEAIIIVELLAAPSDPNGQPVVPSTPVRVAVMQGNSPVRVLAASGPASVTGTLGAVVVSQNPQFIRGGLTGLPRYNTPAYMTQQGYSTNR